MIEIAFLVDHPDAITTLTQWFRDQWPEYYAARSRADIAQDFYAEANRDGLPVRLLAFMDGTLAGTVTLRDQALRGFPEYQPGIGGLLVAEQHRGPGIGTALVRSGMQLAREQDYGTVYIATVTARGIVEHLGWELVQAVSHMLFRLPSGERPVNCLKEPPWFRARRPRAMVVATWRLPEPPPAATGHQMS